MKLIFSKSLKFFAILSILVLLNSCVDNNENLLSEGILGWEKTTETVFKKTKLYDYIDGEADNYLKNGFELLISQRYTNTKTNDSIVVDIYQMSNPDCSHKIYDYYKSPKIERIDVGKEGVITDYTLDFWKDKYFVRMQIYNITKESRKNMIAIARKISDKIAK